ncbi:MAG: hypothetical protein ABI824_16800 [Acidobacteriota bacterium]
MRTGRQLPPLAKALVGIGFEPAPGVRMKWRALPPAFPMDPMRSMDAETDAVAVQDTPQVPQPADAQPPLGATSVSESSERVQPVGSSAHETDPGTAIGQHQEISAAASMSSVASNATANAPTTIEQPAHDVPAFAEQVPQGYPDAESAKAPRKLPRNVRTWQDHAWEVRDWEGNLLSSSFTASAGGSADAVSSGDRKAS